VAGLFGGNVHITGDLIVDGAVSAKVTPGMGIAVVHFSQNADFILSKNIGVTTGRLTVSERGRYVVFVRAVLRNNDGDPQSASAVISDGKGEMDRVDVEIPGRSRIAISLQGVLEVGNINTVNLTCATFAGDALGFSIFAVQVSDIKPGA
jgi:hypothetical protein